MDENNKKYFWLRLKRDFFKRHDIRIIESMPNGKDYLLFYLKLLCESVDHEGNLRFNKEIPYSEDMLSIITSTNVDIVRNAIKIFTELGMMELLDDGTYFMSEVDKMIGCETEWAEKKRKQRLLPKLTNGSVRLNGEMLKLPNGETRYVDEKRYGGNGMLALDRASGKCELCGSEENVVIHHNNGYSNEINDLLCLCSKCHNMVHSKYGGQFPPSVLSMSDKSKSIEIEKEIYIKENNNTNNCIIKEKSPTSRFSKPSVEEIEEYTKSYCLSKHNTKPLIDAETFYNFYESKNWFVGKNKMKDWKAAIRTWISKEIAKNPNIVKVNEDVYRPTRNDNDII